MAILVSPPQGETSWLPFAVEAEPAYRGAFPTAGWSLLPASGTGGVPASAGGGTNCHSTKKS